MLAAACVLLPLLLLAASGCMIIWFWPGGPKRSTLRIALRNLQSASFARFSLVYRPYIASPVGRTLEAAMLRRSAQQLSGSLLVQLHASSAAASTACSSSSLLEAVRGIASTACAQRRLLPPTAPVRPEDGASNLRWPAALPPRLLPVPPPPLLPPPLLVNPWRAFPLLTCSCIKCGA